ncbi:ankyrin repeat domain-containing protein [Mycena alexandri]|uniref:Ankyrin repeat domain-containing protein n=1 Tax=Mycena alexandri TaxID=1745969 RepID=A0AAD6T999_9AGAR|nr:ankyrin repeat domain-containing protein [Mycena alexandri]
MCSLDGSLTSPLIPLSTISAFPFSSNTAGTYAFYPPPAFFGQFWLPCGTGGAGGQGDNEGGHGGPGEGSIVNTGPVTIVINHSNKEDRMDASHLAFLDWFSPINFFLRHADISQVREKGTGAWLLAKDVFQQWKSQSGGTLWCRGMSCIYLNYKEARDQTPPKLLAGVWRQLVFNRDLGSDAKKLYQEHKEKGTAPSLEEVASVLSSSLKKFSKVFVIIDAIDEYPELQRIILLQNLTTMGSNVNLMITSRQNISPHAFSFENLETLDIYPTKEDLQTYIDAQIKLSPLLSEHIKENPGLREDIHAKITSTVDGMFLLAKLHLESLSTKNTIKAVRGALKELPKDLHDSYDVAIQRIDAQHKDNRKTARSTLTWVANAKRPLTVEELRVALAVEPGTHQLDKENLMSIQRIVSVCAGLVIVDERLSVVRLVHYSVQEYLDSIQAQQFPDAQVEITSTLLTFLTFDGYPSSSWELRNLPPLLEYSQYCLVHAAGQPEVQLREVIVKFLGQAFQWMNIMTHNAIGPPMWDSMPWDYSHHPSQPSALWFAASANLVETTKFLLEGASLDSLPQHSMSLEGDPEIIVASYYGHKEIVCVLLEKGADVDVAGSGCGSSLQAAATRGHTEIVCILLDKGATVNAMGGGYGSSLQAAAGGGHTGTVSCLLEKGADVNAAGGYYGSSLQAAAAGGHTGTASHLLEEGADVNAVGGYYGTSLQAAAAGGHTGTASRLLEKGADVNAVGGYYGTSLQAAAAGGHTGTASCLLEKGADVNAIGGYYGSSLQAAAAGGHTGTASRLLEEGADVNAVGGYYGTSLQAAAAGGHTGTASRLLEEGADVNAVGGYYRTSLQAAAAGGHTGTASCLLREGADVNAVGGYYGTSLQAAAAGGHTGTASCLLEKGADVNAIGGYYGSSLQAAAAGGHTGTASRLLEERADVNAVGGFYGTSLQAAAAGGHTGTASCLLEKGADVNAVGGYYGTSSQAAAARGHTKILQLCLQQGARFPLLVEDKGDAQ